MSKPYTLVTVGGETSSASSASFNEGQNRCQGKNIMVACNR